MEVPELVTNAGIYLFVWKAQQVRIRIDRLRESRGILSGEIVIETTLPASPGHLHQARLNLSSTTSRRSLCQLLIQRFSGPEWESMIEQACTITLRAYRQGEPVVNLADVAIEPAARFILDPFIIEGEPVLIYGEGGSGKSAFAQLVALIVQCGLSCKEINLYALPHRVLYLDYETNASVVKARIEAIRKGFIAKDKMTISAFPNILYRRCSNKLSYEIEDIQRLVIENQIGLVIIDSVGVACGGELEGAESTIEYFRALRSLRISSLSIDHVAKGNSKETSPYGSVYKTNLARSVWEIKKFDQDEANDNAIMFGLHHRKVNSGKLERPVGFSLEFMGDTIACYPAGVSLTNQITQLLRVHKELTVKEMAEILNDNIGVLRTTLNRGKDEVFKQIENALGEKEKKWCLL